MSRELAQYDPWDPKKIYDELIERCKAIRMWEIRCIVDESWVGIAPFDIVIQDGIFICYVAAPSRREAFLEVVNKLPVVKFLSRQDED